MRAYLNAIFRSWPGATGYVIRRWSLSRQLMRCGTGLTIDTGCAFNAPENISVGSAVSCGARSFFAADGGEIEIGNAVAFNANVHVNASAGRRIVIGDDVLVGPNVVIRSADHRFDRVDVPIRRQGHNAGEIIIEDGAWLGANVVVVGNVRIGAGAIIAAGAVVTRDVPSMAIAGGVPARVLKMRDGAAGA